MAGPTSDGFYDLTSGDDIFEMTPSLLAILPRGLRGLDGNDSITGSLDAEIINGNQGSDTLGGNDGNDSLYGGKEYDFLFGGNGDDFISGGLDNDQVVGNEGNDILRGGKGNDGLAGLEGNDILVGDFGTDSLIGGNGNDIFVLNTEGAVSDPELADMILDFDPNIDKIGLTGAISSNNIVLESRILTDGNTDTLIRLQTTGEVLGRVLGVSRQQLTIDKFISADNLIGGNNSNQGLLQTEFFTPEPIRINLNTLPAPLATPSTANPAEVVPIPNNPVLKVPPGFQVNVFADKLDAPRWLSVTPSGDVLVTETSKNQITLLRDLDKNGTADVKSVFAGPENGLNQPFGMAFGNGSFFVGNTDSVVKFNYSSGQTQINGNGTKIADLPTGGHWTRNLALSPDNKRLFVAIGSQSNASTEPLPRASVQVINLDAADTSLKTYAFGLRNPVGLDFHPQTKQLFTTVNERDGLGDNLVPDYLAGLEQDQFYGWPYAYLSPKYIDPRVPNERPDLAAQTKTPQVLFQAHSAPLGLQFYDGNSFPQKYRNGAFVAFRGSWNRKDPTGYKVVFAPFGPDNVAIGNYEDFVTGFQIGTNGEQTWGRPTGLQVMPDGSLLFTDEENDRIYRVQYN